MAAQKNDPKHSDEDEAIRETRTEQLTQIRETISLLEPQLHKLVKHDSSQLALLESVSLGLYDEIDKLSKKAPAEAATDLVLEQMNEVIREVRNLIIDDPYVQRLQEFVAAGDNPQHRDAVVVMRQVRQGLSRFRLKISPLIKKLNRQLNAATAIEKVLELYLEGSLSVKQSDVGIYNLTIPAHWIDVHHYFDFKKLDRTDINIYFSSYSENDNE